MRIAVIGAGVSGLTAAYLLHRNHEVTLFEADERAGGHANTVEVDLDDGRFAVDTGFIVYNDANYPLFSGLLAELGVETQPSPMSFSVSDGSGGSAYRATSVSTLFAERRRVLDLRFHRMLVDIARFNRIGQRLLAAGQDTRSIGEVLHDSHLSRQLRDRFVIPLGSAIWSADPTTFDEMPALTYLRFMANHGLLSFGEQPRWRTVTGGSRRYVERLVAPLRGHMRLAAAIDKLVRHDDGVEVHTTDGEAIGFDAVVVAVHADDALALLSDPSPEEREVLGAMRYQTNTATLHTDERLLPRPRRAWASWNYHLLDHPSGRATVTYHMNQLQSLASRHQLLVTLNRDDAIDPTQVIRRFTYAHPILDAAAVRAQTRRHELQGNRRSYYCGAYWGFGFHEDGVRSAYDVARMLGVR